MKLKSLKSGQGISLGVTLPDRGKEFEVDRQHADMLVAAGLAEYADSADVRKKVLDPVPVVIPPPASK